tara:strand:- start:381 stop:1346 length:966 start_codon:yes stop_codon:yes gene_type:complete
MKILFIGTGGFGYRHAMSVRALRPNAKLFAVRDDHNDTTLGTGMELVPSIKAGLTLSPSAAIIALPPALHAAAAKSVLAEGIATYVEKPIAMRCADLKDAVITSELRNTTTMAGCNLRFLQGFKIIQKTIKRGHLGRVVHASMSVGRWLPDWRRGRDYTETYSAIAKMGGGVILDLIHEIDLARFWFGEFTNVSAVAGNTGALAINSEDHADIILSSNKLDVCVHLDYLDREGHRSGRIIMESGTLNYDAVNGQVFQFNVKTGVRKNIARPEDFDFSASERTAMAHFLDCVEAGIPTKLPLREGLSSLRLAERARQSAGIL